MPCSPPGSDDGGDPCVLAMTLTAITDVILDEDTSPNRLRCALEEFARLCADISHIQPDPSFDAWADDSLLDEGVAINPRAAAHCVMDYRRSAVFIRGVHAAILTARERFPDTAIEILYAGCGPFATLMLPLLGRFAPSELSLTLLDYHQSSLDSVKLLLDRFELAEHRITFVRDNACHYTHAGKPQVIIAETMQKSLEQEPQFAITANLAPQLCPNGIFIPEEIEVALCLAQLEQESALFERTGTVDSKTLVAEDRRYPLATLCTLSPDLAYKEMASAKYNAATKKVELQPTVVRIPSFQELQQFAALLFTRIRVYEQYRLLDYESEITLPLECRDMMRLRGGDQYEVSYQLGSYPRFNFVRCT